MVLLFGTGDVSWADTLVGSFDEGIISSFLVDETGVWRATAGPDGDFHLEGNAVDLEEHRATLGGFCPTSFTLDYNFSLLQVGAGLYHAFTWFHSDGADRGEALGFDNGSSEGKHDFLYNSYRPAVNTLSINRNLTLPAGEWFHFRMEHDAPAGITKVLIRPERTSNVLLQRQYTRVSGAYGGLTQLVIRNSQVVYDDFELSCAEIVIPTPTPSPTVTPSPTPNHRPHVLAAGLTQLADRDGQARFQLLALTGDPDGDETTHIVMLYHGAQRGVVIHPDALHSYHREFSLPRWMVPEGIVFPGLDVLAIDVRGGISYPWPYLTVK